MLFFFSRILAVDRMASKLQSKRKRKPLRVETFFLHFFPPRCRTLNRKWRNYNRRPGLNARRILERHLTTSAAHSHFSMLSLPVAPSALSGRHPLMVCDLGKTGKCEAEKCASPFPLLLFDFAITSKSPSTAQQQLRRSRLSHHPSGDDHDDDELTNV